MKLKPNQLSSQLAKPAFSFIYLLTGDEPLQMRECTDMLRTFAKRRGFTERVVFTVETHFDWGLLEQEANSLSLFAQKRLLELHLGNKSPGNDGSKALIEYTQRPPTDTILLITTDKLDSSQQKSKWFTAIEERGIVIQIWPLEPAQLPTWISQRLQQYGLQASAETIQILAERSEGHLLACEQEIEKLHLLYGKGYLETRQVLDAVVDSARFEVFDWLDTVLAGEKAACNRQLQRLQAEGVEPIIIIWALNKEIRMLCQVSYAMQTGQSPEQLFKIHRVWQNRQAIITKALKRHSPRQWQHFLQETVKIERIIKGVDSGNVWDELQRLSLRVAGVKLL